MVQGLMGNYMEQSRQVFLKMQEQMAKQATTMFPGPADAEDAAQALIGRRLPPRAPPPAIERKSAR